MSEQTKERKKFVQNKPTTQDVDTQKDFDLMALYKQAHSELTLQQEKRDKIITLYLSVFSLLIPFAFSLKDLSLFGKGLIFIAVGIIGIIFSVIIIRYRIYKEVYWLSCETITRMMRLKNGSLTKDNIQSLFYDTLKKKSANFRKNDVWSSYLYFKKNLFSSETLHYLVITLLTSIILGLGVFLVVPLKSAYALLIAVAVGLTVLTVLFVCYFKNSIKVYAVIKDGLDSSFNSPFTKAWFLHIYLDRDELSDGADNADGENSDGASGNDG